MVAGNLTRVNNVVPALISRRADEALLLLLQHPNEDIVLAVTGTLVNITGHPAGCDSLILLGAMTTIQPLISLLRRNALRNVSSAVLVCQVLHNLLSINNHDGKASNEKSMDGPSPTPVAKMFRQQRVLFVSDIPDSLEETLLELIDYAEDIVTSTKNESIDQNHLKKVQNHEEDEDSDEIVQHEEFIRISKQILVILCQRPLQ